MPRIVTRFARDKIAAKYADLEREWYAKLAATGFVDIEPYDNPMNTRMVSHWHTTMQQCKRGVETGSAEFHRLLYEWLDETRYRVRGDRFLLAARAEGFDWNELADRFGFDTAGVRKRVLKQSRAMLKSYGLTPRGRRS